jgi:selenium-binding protein 1
MNPKLSGSVHLGGIARRTPHPNSREFLGGPQMTEISRDGKRVHFTNSLYSTWDKQFYLQSIPGRQVMCHVGEDGGIALDESFCVDFGEGYSAHQIRLQGGDCSTDSYCYPSA